MYVTYDVISCKVCFRLTGYGFARLNIESIDKHEVSPRACITIKFHAKLQPVVAVRSLLPRSRPKYIVQAVVVLYAW